MVFIGWILFGLSYLSAYGMFENTLMHSVMLIMLFIAINYVLMLPFELYQTFGLDKKFGFFYH
ncbi:MAG: hypothetical protein LRY68_10935 [Sulfurospirillum sp.]|nr:hypothetical protein [Sulfurospirillum sp.]